MTTLEQKNNLRIKELEELIQKNIYYYYNAQEKVSDFEFDSWIDELSSLNPNSPVLSLLESSVGDYPKVKLPFRLYSQRKIKDFTNLKNWEENLKIVKKKATIIATPKYDGIHLLEFEGNYYTRGTDGIEGFNVTSRVNLFSFNKAPKDCGYAFGGELICSKENFEKYFKNQGYRSPRNLIQALFSNETNNLPKHLDKIDYIRYHVYNLPYNKENQLDICNLYNQPKIPYAIFDLSNIKEELLDNKFEEWEKDFKIDGIVLDLDDNYLRKQLGFINKYPQYSRAFKPDRYNQELKLTKIKNIRWQISRYGKLTPVAEVEPTELNDGIVTNVSLYNAKYIIDNKICVGKEGFIFRSGSINPKFASFKDEEENSAELITKCPFCKQDLIWDESQVNLYCPNEDCFEINSQKINYFFKTLGIKDFGLKTIRNFVLTGNLNTVYDFLDKSKFENLKVEGVGPKTIESFFDQLQKLKDSGVELEKIQEASGIFEGLASITLKILNQHKVDVEYLYKDSYFNFMLKKIKDTKEIGEITALIYINNLPDFWEFYNKVKEYFPLKEKKIKLDDTPLQDLICCFSGFRDEILKQKIEALGGKVLSSVSSKCTALVVKDKSDLTSSKCKKALDLNISILNLEEFKEKNNL